VGLTGAKAIAAGESHTCAVLSDGGVKCWGKNDKGQLGDGTTTNAPTPVAVSGLTNAKQVTAGGGHSCALLADRTAKCWGFDALGQLGDGATTDTSKPVAVSGGIAGIVSIAAGGAHTCAALGVGASCWGANPNGQLGNGSKTASSTPVPVSGLSDTTGAIGIAASGGAHSCAVLADITARCWGANTVGQLGDGTTTDSTIPVAVGGLGGPVKMIATGVAHSCALLADATMQCWGNNVFGQLGDGTSKDSKTPVVVK
jgi:alpha-tubulin suppressor-like RCC1 family protein